MGRKRLWHDETRQCKQCGDDFIFTAKAQGSGRPGLYCSTSCSVVIYQVNQVRFKEQAAKITEMKRAGYI